MTAPEPKWHPHKPGDPMMEEPSPRAIQVGDDVRHELGQKKVGTVLAIAGQEAAVLWTYGLRSHDLHSLRLAGPDPAQQSEPVKPERRWISVEEQPHPTDGKTWFWAQWRATGCSPCIADLKYDSITHWCPLLDQPPEFIDLPKPLTDEEKLAIAAEALREAVDAYGKPGGPWNVPSDPGGWLNRATEALAKIEGEK